MNAGREGQVFLGRSPVSDPGLANGGNYVREDKHLCLFLQKNKWLFYSEGADGCLSIALRMCFVLCLGKIIDRVAISMEHIFYSPPFIRCGDS